MNVTEFVIVAVLFAAVSVVGFLASRWRRSRQDSLEEWALAGRGFRSWISWFVVGGGSCGRGTCVIIGSLSMSGR